VHGVFCKTITKTSQITNNIDKVLPKFYNFIIKRFTSAMDPVQIVLLTPIRQNSKLKSGGARTPQKWKWGDLDPCGPPRFCHLWRLLKKQLFQTFLVP